MDNSNNEEVFNINHTTKVTTINNNAEITHKGTYEKTTHLYLQEKQLKKIPIISGYKSVLQALYLYNNEIRTIENLNNMSSITSLYLHHNKIERLENLKALRNLKKLYLGHNCITILEGIECLGKLEELHLEKQNLSDNVSLCFDPRCVSSLASTLKVLNIASNNVVSLAPLAQLRKLETLNAANNTLESVEDVSNTIKQWKYLREATFIGNKITKEPRYRESLIANTHCLELLDNKYITDSSREFIKRFKEERTKFTRQPSVNLADYMTDIPKNQPVGVQKSVSASVLKTQKSKMDDLTTFDEKNAVYTAWNALPKSKIFAKWKRSAKKTPQPDASTSDLKKSPSLEKNQNEVPSADKKRQDYSEKKRFQAVDNRRSGESKTDTLDIRDSLEKKRNSMDRPRSELLEVQYNSDRRRMSGDRGRPADTLEIRETIDKKRGSVGSRGDTMEHRDIFDKRTSIDKMANRRDSNEKKCGEASTSLERKVIIRDLPKGVKL